MSRRLLALATAALATLAGTGCADDVAPAAQIGDVRITESELLDEVQEWADSAVVLRALRYPADQVAGTGPSSYSTQFVDVVLSSRLLFEASRAEFEARGLEVEDDLRGQIRDRFFGGAPEGDELVDALIDDIARGAALQEDLGEEGYAEWQARVTEDIEVNPRYGAWDPESGQVVPPDDPAAPTSPAFAP